jgi:hypothetical protein
MVGRAVCHQRSPAVASVSNGNSGVSWIGRTDGLFRLISDLRFSSPPGIILSSTIPLKDAMNASVELPDSNLSATDPDFEQALAEVRTAALEHHRNGRMDEAESLYRMVLDARPSDADINYNMGVIVYGRAVRRGRSLLRSGRWRKSESRPVLVRLYRSLDEQRRNRGSLDRAGNGTAARDDRPGHQ